MKWLPPKLCSPPRLQPLSWPWLTRAHSRRRCGKVTQTHTASDLLDFACEVANVHFYGKSGLEQHLNQSAQVKIQALLFMSSVASVF